MAPTGKGGGKRDHSPSVVINGKKSKKKSANAIGAAVVVSKKQTTSKNSKAVKNNNKGLNTSTSLDFSEDSYEDQNIISTVVENKTVHIFCHSIDDKKTIIANLTENKFVFHSFAEPSDKTKVFVLKGYFHETDLITMCKEFQDVGVKCNKISFLSKKEDFPIYLVHFEDCKTSIITLQRQHRFINGLLIKWETKTKSSRRPTQCFKCQLFGHAATNCNRPYRCVKCVDQHEPGQCKRTTREGNASCVNCKGEHPAKSVDCPQYKKYIDII
jgi:hypothetical protein